MQKNILWKGIDQQSFENCIVSVTAAGITARSYVVGMAENMLFRVSYQLTANPGWTTTRLIVIRQAQDKIISTQLESDGKGNWSENGQPAPRFKDCIDVDISVTPFTNTLPVKRLVLAERMMVKVVYVDIFKAQLLPVEQYYTKLSPQQYRFEQPRISFEAMITMDTDGFVQDYPGLFVQQAIINSNYPLTGNSR